EVVLNLAESAIGINRLADGLEGIKEIRRRAGIVNGDGHYGLADVAGNRDKLFKAVLEERKIEFAYEGKRFYDLRRWMLFDDATGMNTRLGIPVLNGTRRTGYRISVKTTAGVEYVGNDDPLLKRTTGSNAGTAPVIDRDATAFPSGVSNYDAYVDYLYDNHFMITEKDDLDKAPTGGVVWRFKWYPEYYYFGIHQNLLDASPYLEQTTGWNSMNGSGTFNPLL
ncbi:RagB/SusD family nutrient uptake outer membrane protein, partial [Pseudoxanthomonas sp. SGD-10]